MFSLLLFWWASFCAGFSVFFRRPLSSFCAFPRDLEPFCWGLFPDLTERVSWFSVCFVQRRSRLWHMSSARTPFQSRGWISHVSLSLPGDKRTRDKNILIFDASIIYSSFEIYKDRREKEKEKTATTKPHYYHNNTSNFFSLAQNVDIPLRYTEILRDPRIES